MQDFHYQTQHKQLNVIPVGGLMLLGMSNLKTETKIVEFSLIFQTISVHIETGVLPVCVVEIGLNHPFYSPLVEWQL